MSEGPLFDPAGLRHRRWHSPSLGRREERTYLKGGLDNARYWYKRAERTFSPDAKSELAAARRTLDA